jgi:ubiquinone/menaquinone biosynthesis C-methylase UbiE
MAFIRSLASRLGLTKARREREGLIDPRRFIEDHSVEELGRRAEEFFTNVIAPNPMPHMAKPFTDSLHAPIAVYKLGLLMEGLKLGTAVVVLDFAAGTCWLSRLLAQMGCCTISVDVSETALEIGRKLFEKSPIIGDLVRRPQFLVFDGHRIALEDGSVDRIVCFDAFHHIPNQREIIEEFHRVLRPNGVVGFSEPGSRHSRSAAAQHDMRTYGVLENDIHLSDIAALAKTVGFRRVYHKPVATMDFEVPTRFRKTRLLVQWGKLLLATRWNALFFLEKGAHVLDSRCLQGLGHRIETPWTAYRAVAGEPLQMRFQITNVGSGRWLHESEAGFGVVSLGMHLYDARGALISCDFFRSTFDREILPGEQVLKEVSLTLSKRGDYRLAVDLVAERITWFEHAGSQPAWVQVTVE